MRVISFRYKLHDLLLPPLCQRRSRHRRHVVAKSFSYIQVAIRARRSNSSDARPRSNIYICMHFSKKNDSVVEVTDIIFETRGRAARRREERRCGGGTLCAFIIDRHSPRHDDEEQEAARSVGAYMLRRRLVIGSRFAYFQPQTEPRKPVSL